MPRWLAAAFLLGLIFFAVQGLPDAAYAQGTNAPGTGNADTTGAIEAPIGKVAQVTGTATVEHSGTVVVQANLTSGTVPVKMGDFVYRGDAVQTGADGTLGLIFSDGTAFNLSNNARMVLNEFVYDPKGSSNSTLFQLARGNFTFVAGKIAKTGDMKLDTPVATMGIRGTTPRVEISDNGAVKFSTLVEEEGSSPIKRNVQSQPPPPSGPDPYSKFLNLHLNICRGC